MTTPEQQVDELVEKVLKKLDVCSTPWTKQIILSELNLALLLQRPEVCDGTGACPDGKCLMCQLVNEQLKNAQLKSELIEEQRANYHQDYSKAKEENVRLQLYFRNS